MGTPVSSGNQVSTIVPDEFSPYSAGRPEWDPFGAGYAAQLGRPEWDPLGGGMSAFSLLLEPSDPASEGLVVGGARSWPISFTCKGAKTS